MTNICETFNVKQFSKIVNAALKVKSNPISNTGYQAERVLKILKTKIFSIIFHHPSFAVSQ
jgi:hypothetical protein